MFDARLCTFLFDNFLPKLRISIHGLILQEYLCYWFGHFCTILHCTTQPFNQESFCKITTEHKLLITDLSFDLLNYYLFLSVEGSEEKLKYSKGEHLKERIVVKYDWSFEMFGDGCGELFWDIGVIDGLNIVLWGLFTIRNPLVLSEDRLFKFSQA